MTASLAGGRVRQSTARLSDGREIVYFDDTEPYVSGDVARHRVDTRELPVSDGGSLLRYDVLTGEWIAIASDAFTTSTQFAQFRHRDPAKGLRDEAIWGRAHAGKTLRTINSKVARRLIEFILHGIGGNNLDVDINNRGRIRTWNNSVPRVRFEKFREQFV